MRPDDQAAEVMLQRILDLAQNPPRPQWNGVFASREK
jgi:hypothetical protein